MTDYNDDEITELRNILDDSIKNGNRESQINAISDLSTKLFDDLTGKKVVALALEYYKRMHDCYTKGLSIHAANRKYFEETTADLDLPLTLIQIELMDRVRGKHPIDFAIDYIPEDIYYKCQNIYLKIWSCEIDTYLAMAKYLKHVFRTNPDDIVFYMVGLAYATRASAARPHA